MKKNKLAYLLIICFASLMPAVQLRAQSENAVCGTTQYMEYLKQQRPNLETELEQAEVLMQQWMAAHPNARVAGTNAIPVVVHVVWSTASQNVSDLQIQNTIISLNQDYSRTAPDTGDTPAIWQPIAGNLGIQFCLAQRDPFGAPTNGIERRQTTHPAFSGDDQVKSYATGGMDAWDVTRYFNIWLCDLTPGLLGYAEFPTANPSNTFGNVSDYTVVGLTGWVIQHECGHCFNLRHIWGDDSGACTGSDLVADTPNQADATPSPCPSFPSLDACQTASPGIMFMDFMDYGSSSCKNLFTQGQADRAQAALNTLAYTSLLSSDGCQPVVLQQTDAGSQAVVSPTGLLCITTFTPVVRIRNWGTDPLTSATVNYQLDADPLQTYAWSGVLASLATVDITLPSATASAGSHTFTCYTTDPNGLADGNALNDTSRSSFNIITTGQAAPLVYGFEPVTFPPTDWTLDNQDGSLSWARTTGAAKTGVASMWFNSINYPCNGCIDIINMPNLDLTSISNPQLTFQVAYQMLSDPTLSPNWSDSLRVDISTDCGLTWTNLYFKYSTNLTTIVPVFSTTAFVPTQDDWRLETIDLGAYAANNNVMLRFKVTSDYENNMYVDDINIQTATGIEEVQNNGAVSVYPNPVKDILTLSLHDFKSSSVKINVSDVTGKIILVKNVNLPVSRVELDIQSVSSGMYLITVSGDKKIHRQKIIVQH